MSWRGTEKNAIGAKLIHVEYNDDEVKLITDKGILSLAAFGDCCSHSWFESMENHGAIGGLITELDFGCSDADDVTAKETKHRDDQVLAYFPTIKTTTGRVMLEMRNASNGFYGGSISASWASAGE